MMMMVVTKISLVKKARTTMMMEEILRMVQRLMVMATVMTMTMTMMTGMTTRRVMSKMKKTMMKKRINHWLRRENQSNGTSRSYGSKLNV